MTKGLFPLPQGVVLRGGFGDSRRIRATIVASVDRLLGPVSITAASCVAWPAIVSGLCCVLVGANNGTVALRWGAGATVSRGAPRSDWIQARCAARCLLR